MLGRQNLAASLPDISLRPLAIRVGNGCLAVVPLTMRATLARPSAPNSLTILALYRSVRPPQGIARGPRGRPYRPDFRCPPASESDRPDANAVVRCLGPAFRGARPCPPVFTVPNGPSLGRPLRPWVPRPELYSHMLSPRAACGRFRVPTGWPLAVSRQLGSRFPGQISSPATACQSCSGLWSSQQWLSVNDGWMSNV